MPMAVMLPRCQNGGASEEFSARKPTIVVALVITTGKKLIVMLSLSAVTLSFPSRISVSIETRMWTLSAIAKRQDDRRGGDSDMGSSLIPM